MQARIINTDRYPVDDLSSTEARHWVARVRSQLERDGSCLLADFVNPETLGQEATAPRYPDEARLLCSVPGATAGRILLTKGSGQIISHLSDKSKKTSIAARFSTTASAA